MPVPHVGLLLCRILDHLILFLLEIEPPQIVEPLLLFSPKHIHVPASVPRTPTARPPDHPLPLPARKHPPPLIFVNVVFVDVADWLAAFAFIAAEGDDFVVDEDRTEGF